MVFLPFMVRKWMRYKVGFRDFGNFPIFADSFPVVSIQYFARRLRGSNTAAGNYD